MVAASRGVLVWKEFHGQRPPYGGCWCGCSSYSFLDSGPSPCRPSSKSRKLSCECALLTRSSHYLPWLISRLARKNRRILSVPRVAVPVISSSIQVSAVAATRGLSIAPNNIHCYARFSRRAPAAGIEDYRFEFTQDDSAIWVTATGGKRHRSVKVDWAFGSGNQGITFVSRLSSQSYRSTP